MEESMQNGEELSPQKVLRLAENHIRRALVALEFRLDAIENGEDTGFADSQKALIEARKAMQTYFDERKRIHELGDKASIGGDSCGLDLERARSEIRSRLDRIRAAHGAGGVSGKPG